jgi:ribosome-binding protein aMBF1 (putative translation factor)
MQRERHAQTPVFLARPQSVRFRLSSVDPQSRTLHRRSVARDRKVAAAFGRVLREARERKNLSQEELAFRSGISRTYPSLLERARRQPSLTVLLAVADGLEVRADFLLNRTLDEMKG